MLQLCSPLSRPFVRLQEARAATDDGHHLQVLSDQAQQLRSRDKIISEMRSRQQGLTGAHAGRQTDASSNAVTQLRS